MKKNIFATLMSTQLILSFSLIGANEQPHLADLSSLALNEEAVNSCIDLRRDCHSHKCKRCPTGPTGFTGATGATGATGPSGLTNASYITAYRTPDGTGSSVPAGTGTVGFNEEGPTNGTIDPGTLPYTTFTVPSTGTYLVSWVAYFTLGAGPADILINVLLNDVAVPQGNLGKSSTQSGPITMSGSVLVSAETGDSISLQITRTGETPTLHNPTFNIIRVE